MKLLRYIVSGLTVIFLFSIFPVSTVLAADTNGKIVKYKVVVIEDPATPDKVLKNVYVNMYRIKVVDDQYVGTRVKTLTTSYNGYRAVFKVWPGRVVDFLPFNSKNEAKSIENKKHIFTAPPLKNFSKNDAIAQLCLTAGVDFTKKLTDKETGEEFCNLQGQLVLE
ncbi:hypothetical protein A3B60_00500 [Candidatus Peregrinibacteria bacterium RIFCSPLOWO2_01_FULL_39_12]|nr:MAG: hypothetical protein A3B60_00500 [Candidatus Peregrinibacteria bacterium RIFCSPLOWO2_01_FULL_39_12]